MTLWWLQDGWKDACCSRCGANIWDSGGDPDHGVCFECFFEEQNEQQLREEEDAHHARLKAEARARAEERERD